jgi:Na+/H+ antiporter NhaD/arsenite permease-like protein
MEPGQLTVLLIFLGTVTLIISGIIDVVIASFLGVLLMIVTGAITDVNAFESVEWNVICILTGIWTIALYFGKTGIPEWLACRALKYSRGSIASFCTFLGCVAGVLSMFIDNVVVILMMAPVVFHVTRRIKLPTFPFIIFIGLCSNFYGTALLLGDLPPQMLHGVSGIEFLGFIWHSGRPSSFIILSIVFFAVAGLFLLRFKKTYRGQEIGHEELNDLLNQQYIKDKRFAWIVVMMFFGTVLAMSFRQVIGVKLGLIALTGAVLLVLILEVLAKTTEIESPSLEAIFAEFDWRAVFFYVLLFALVGGLEHSGIIKKMAEAFVPIIRMNYVLGASLVYWITTPIVGIVEHDAYILTFLYMFRDMGNNYGINPWPLYWAMLWAGTLGSNLTIAGAPALLVALNLSQREDQRRITLKEFLSYSVPYVIFSHIFCFLLALCIWILPMAP